MKHIQENTDCELVITRIFNAPRSLVWDAWTNPKDIEQWFGPEGFSTKVPVYTFKVNGNWEYVMIGPDKTQYPCEGHFTEIVDQKRIVSTDEFGDESQSNGITGLITTTTFEDVPDTRTKVTIRIMHPDVETKQKHEEMGVVKGWESSFKCLDAYIKLLHKKVA